jgi:cytochrome c-type biogenesis protein CcmH
MRTSLARRVPLPVVAIAVLMLLPIAALGAPRPTLPALEPQLMCVTCKIPLNVAESAEATQERELIRELIAKGKDEAQIKNEMVAEYGPSVIATPSTKGFDLAAYLIPILVVLALIAVAVTLLPRWRRATREREGQSEAMPTLTSADAQRLEQDMKRFD